MKWIILTFLLVLVVGGGLITHNLYGSSINNDQLSEKIKKIKK